MSTSDAVLRSRLPTMQIIALALPAGVIIFLGLVGWMVLSGQPAARADQPLPIISIVAVVMLASVIVPALVVPAAMAKGQLEQIARGDGRDDLAKLLGLKQTTMIITMALFEGAAFTGCIALLMERQLWALAVPLVALAVMFFNFPTENGVRNWLEMQARRVQELRGS
jgi:hypothetical protein